MTSSKKSAASSDSSTDAIALLTADHRKVKNLFTRFEDLKEQEDADDEKDELVQLVCNELRIHAQLEEELFYPAVREAIDDDGLMDEAEVEHASAMDLLTQLETMHPRDHLYDARVIVLSEMIAHHVKEEEREMFPKAKKAKVNTADLGRKIKERKETLMAELEALDAHRRGAVSGSTLQHAGPELAKTH